MVLTIKVACFYVRLSRSGNNPSHLYYHAIYLTERKAEDLMQRICEKHLIDPRQISHIVHVVKDGLKIMVDDDFVQEIAEGQDMVVELDSTPASGGGSLFEMRLLY